MATFPRKEGLTIFEGMRGSRKHRYEGMLRGWRLLATRLVVAAVAIALTALIPVMPAGSATEKDMSTVSMSFNAGDHGQVNISSGAGANHMHFEHHQLVRCANDLLIPSREPGRACFLTRVNLFSSSEPAPPEKPPRV
jgi:hypothetical protein